MQDTNTSYKKGFNEGYLITKHLPELSDQLSKIKNETPRIEGFKDGRNQIFQEKAKERLSLSFTKNSMDERTGFEDHGNKKDAKNEIDKE